MSTCNGCGAAIVWLKTAKGKNMCVDENETALAYKRDGAEFDPKDDDLVPHWANCPDADKFKKRT